MSWTVVLLILIVGIVLAFGWLGLVTWIFGGYNFGHSHETPSVMRWKRRRKKLWNKIKESF